MKEAMWGVGLIFVTMFGFFLVSIFGNITVTNQQDYTAMTNTVEAAMNDAMDIAHFRSGFCICSSKEKQNGKWDFNNSNEYEIRDPENGTCPAVSYKTCELIEGEYKIDKKVFAESLVRRFSQSVKANNDYQIVIQDVIEYPPKVSVLVKAKAKDNYVTVGGDYTITNQIDSILESYDTFTIPPDATPKPEADACYYSGDSTRQFCWGKSKDCKGYSLYTEITNKADCVNTCYCQVNGTNCGVWAKRYWDGYVESPLINGQCMKPTPTPRPVEERRNEPEAPRVTSSPRRTATPKPSTRGCFLAGTKVMTLFGYKNIETIQSGDYVLTYNEEKKINEYKKVVQLFTLENLDEELYTIKTDNTEIKLTGHHRIYTYRDGNYQYVAAEELKVGDITKYADGKYHKIEEITHESIDKTVYNLEIEDNHNFYVGDKGILVHNARMGTNNSGLNK